MSDGEGALPSIPLQRPRRAMMSEDVRDLAHADHNDVHEIDHVYLRRARWVPNDIDNRPTKIGRARDGKARDLDDTTEPRLA